LYFQESAVHRRPTSPRQHLLLAEVYDRADRTPEAAKERAEAALLAKSAQE